ncbi:MAG: hypothetical protein NZ805_06500 [Armatimonadetes bacterium]|nr:hypothetical protein [Armatimonadota bacterium]
MRIASLWLSEFMQITAVFYKNQSRKATLKILASLQFIHGIHLSALLSPNSLKTLTVKVGRILVAMRLGTGFFQQYNQIAIRPIATTPINYPFIQIRPNFARIFFLQSHAFSSCYVP